MHRWFLITCFLPSIAGWSLLLSPNEERLLNRRAGDNFLVVCKVKDFDGAASDVTVEWFKDSTPIPRFGSSMTIERPYSNQLMINRPKPTDGGQYLCRAQIGEEKQEITAQISFVEPPKFIDPRTEQHPEEGTRAEILCQVEGTQQLEVFWQFNGVTLDESSQRGYEFSENRQTLYVPHYTAKKDDGVYSCNAAQFSSFETLNINVTGYARPTITVFEVPTASRGFEGQAIELKCGAVGKPMPTYKWYFEKAEGVVIEASDKYKVDEGLLIVDGIRGEDAGQYKCVASNQVGTDERTVNISVFLKPKVEVETEYVKKEGENVEIICHFGGDGIVKSKFLFGNQEFSVQNEPSTTVASSVESEDNVDAEANPEEEESENETAVSETSEESTTLAPEALTESEEEEEEEESRRWKRFADDVESERITVREEEGKLILSVKQVSLDDAGAYICHVSNEAGTTNKTTHVNIIHPPTLRHYTGPKIRSYQNNTLTIFCEVSAVPSPTWKWLKDGAEVEANGASVVIDSHGLITKLTLTHEADSENYGLYSCKADNGVGVLEKIVDVIEVVAPTTPSGLDCQKMFYPNFAKCSFDAGIFDDESGKPLEIEFYIVEFARINADFDWSEALRIKVPYAEEAVIPDLNPKEKYVAIARAVNEAGVSEFSNEAVFETTEPWAPQAPETVRMECSDSCIVSWSSPNNHGAEIKNFHVVVQELEHAIMETTTPVAPQEPIEVTPEVQTVESEDDVTVESAETTTLSSTEIVYEEVLDALKKTVPVGKPTVIDVPAENKELELTNIKPHTLYKISVSAVNEVGQGDALEIEYQTDESPKNLQTGLTTENIMCAVFIALFFLIVIIDFVCYLSNRCGVIACICLNCCGRGSARKEKDIEAGRGPESNRLLDNSASSLKLPLTTTV